MADERNINLFQVEILDDANRDQRQQEEHDLERGRALGHIGSCHQALANHKKAAVFHQEHLAIALKTKSAKDQERAYRELGTALKNTGNLQEALVRIFEY